MNLDTVINKEYYSGILCHSCDAICRKWPYLWKNNLQTLYPDQDACHCLLKNLDEKITPY